MIIISSLWELTDEKLIEAYQKATLMKLDDTFIDLLIEEIGSRGLKDTINIYVS